MLNTIKFHSLSKLLLISSTTLFLFGCTQKVSNVNDTVRLAMFGTPDIHKSATDIKALPYASAYARIGDNAQLFMVLALAEPSLNNTQTNKSSPLQLKWLASDRGMLVTENGRIVKTVNLPDGNLLATHSKTTDPLALGLQLASTPKTWTYSLDWQPGYHMGYQLNSQFQFDHPEVLTINNKLIPTLRFTEKVTVADLNRHYNNIFWVDQQSGKVIKSRQYLAPSLPAVEMTILKPFA